MTISSSKNKTKRTYGGLSEKQRVAERRQRFLDAGFELFGSVGIRGTTVRLLCKEAGLTERYFYESFKDSEDLFCAVYDDQATKLRNHLTVNVQQLQQLQQDPDTSIDASLDIFFTYMRNEKVVRILLIECMAGSQRVIDKHISTMKSYFELSAQLILAGNSQFNIPHSTVLNVASAINSATTSMAALWMLDHYRTPKKHLVQSCAILVRGTINALREQGKAD